MTDQSSCRPDLLDHLDVVVQAMADGLFARSRALAAAVDAYRSSCAGPYQVAVDGAAPAVDRWRGDLRALGTWTGAVSTAFLVADADAILLHVLPFAHVHTRDDTELTAVFQGFRDPFLGVPPPTTDPAPMLGAKVGNQVGPPAWLLAIGGALRVDEPSKAATLISLDAKVARRMQGLDEVAGPLEKWVGRAAVGLQAAAIGKEQWSSDEGLGGPAKVGRAATRVVVVGGASALGEWTGATIGAECVVPPVCSLGLGYVGSLGGEWLGDQATDLLPWMRPGPHEGGEADEEEEQQQLRDAIAAEADVLDRDAAEAVDALAADVARVNLTAGAPLVIPPPKTAGGPEAMGPPAPRPAAPRAATGPTR